MSDPASIQMVGWGLLCAVAIALTVMIIVWFLAKSLERDSIIDVFWSLCIALIAVFFVVMAEPHPTRAFLILAMSVVWGLRLSLYILFRGAGHADDPRYVELREKWGEKQDQMMFKFYMLQGIVAAIFSLPFLLSASNPAPAVTFLEWLSFALWIIAFAGESLADWQLHEFKKDSSNKGKTCRVGLWKYSRHPNYFFEWLIWCSFALLAMSAPFGFIAVLCPILIYHFLVNVTGIPTAEKQSLKSRGEDYKRYQETTSKFFPWFPKD